MPNHKLPYTITIPILKLTSEISELISDIKYIDKNYSTLKLRKKNRVRSITRTLYKYIKESKKSDHKVLTLMRYDKSITIQEICSKLEMSESGVKKVIRKLKDEHKLMRVGSLKAGYWEIIK